MIIRIIKKFGIKAIREFLSVAIILSMFSYVTEQKTNLDKINAISVLDTENVEDAVNKEINVSHIKADVEEDEAVLKLFGIIPVKRISVNKISTDNICLGGTPFGIKLFTKGVIVVGLTDIPTPKGIECPAEKAGIKKGDVILKINGEEINSAETFGTKLSESGSKGVSLQCLRKGEEFETKLIPVVSSSDNKYKAGLWVRDSTAGIGTVTFVDAKTGIFGGLGHGVCDVDTGSLMMMDSGAVVDVNITGVVKGEPHTPGELKGNFFRQTKGSLYSNQETGVFGKLSESDFSSSQRVSIGTKETVTEGKIQIYTTISGGVPKKYDAEIIKICDSSAKTKNFMIKVTDEELLEKAGGIVQGMSGSPILQNGKLIGAVTHVLVNSPEKGYGIFIENMLESANSALEESNKNETKNAA